MKRQIRLVCLIASLLAGSAQAQPPNVLVLLSDDLGYRDIGCYDGPVRTPNLDALAAGGVRFETFYAGCAVCSPSRATLLTGRQHIRTGVYSWIHDPTQRSHLLRRETTLAEILGDQGYATAHIGKWHLGLPGQNYDKPTPTEHGFDYWFATSNNAQPSHRDPVNFIRNGTPVGPMKGYACQIVVDEAIDWLGNRDGDQPFFLNVWFHEPHQKIAAPARLVDGYRNDQYLDEQAAIYSATIENADLAIGRLIDDLKRRGQWDNTLVIYTSDNGSYRDDRTGGLRGRKGVNWEGGLRVPGIIHWPGKVKPSEVDQPAGIVDVLPTVCGLLDVPKPDVHLDGTDLSPLLTGNPENFRRDQPLFWHLQRSRPIVAMRDGDLVLVADPDYPLSTNNRFDEASIDAIRTGGYTNYRLYDLGRDPKQTQDIAPTDPARTQSLTNRLLKINSSIMADATDWNRTGD